MIVAGTGHRPPRLGLGYTAQDNELLRAFAREGLVRLQELTRQPITELVSGMAQGWDQALAEAALDLALPVVCAIAFEGMDKKWPREARERYSHILARAAWIYPVCERPAAHWKFIKRDEWMVNRCDFLLALYDGGPERSGTGLTVAYAHRQGKSVRNLWSAWLARRQTLHGV